MHSKLNYKSPEDYENERKLSKYVSNLMGEPQISF